MNSYTVKVLVTLLSLFVVITVCSQIYLVAKQNYKTETAESYTAYEKVSFNGIYLRDETPITYSGTGVIQYPLPDGSKLAKDSVVANIYTSESGIVNNQRLEKLQNERNMLQKAQNPGTTKVAQPDNLSALIKERYQGVVLSIERGDFSRLSSERTEMLNLMNIMQIVVGKEFNYDVRIAELDAEIASLQASAAVNTPKQSLTVSMPGYFVSYTDGYENMLSIEKGVSLSADRILEIVKNSEENPIPNAIGKIIDGYQWQMIGTFDNTQYMLNQGAKATLYLPSSGASVPVEVVDIRDTSNPSLSILMLSCQELNFSLVQRRVEEVELIINTYTGIRVPRKAIRFLDGVKGVYTRVGQSIVFKNINVIYEGEDYVISKETKRVGDLLLYDDVVVEGISAAEKERIAIQEQALNDIRTTTTANTTPATTTSTTTINTTDSGIVTYSSPKSDEE